MTKISFAHLCNLVNSVDLLYHFIDNWSYPLIFCVARKRTQTTILNTMDYNFRVIHMCIVIIGDEMQTFSILSPGIFLLGEVSWSIWRKVLSICWWSPPLSLLSSWFQGVSWCPGLLSAGSKELDVNLVKTEDLLIWKSMTRVLDYCPILNGIVLPLTQ